jgi:hypothetical protein
MFLKKLKSTSMDCCCIKDFKSILEHSSTDYYCYSVLLKHFTSNYSKIITKHSSNSVISSISSISFEPE